MYKDWFNSLHFPSTCNQIHCKLLAKNLGVVRRKAQRIMYALHMTNTQNQIILCTKIGITRCTFPLPAIKFDANYLQRIWERLEGKHSELFILHMTNE